MTKDVDPRLLSDELFMIWSYFQDTCPLQVTRHDPNEPHIGCQACNDQAELFFLCHEDDWDGTQDGEIIRTIQRLKQLFGLRGH